MRYTVCMEWHTVLVVMHIIGTVLGVGGATFAEVHLIQSLRDGVMEPDESAIMQTTYNILRVGFFLLILSGFGFLILYRLEGLTAQLYEVKLWAKLGIVGIIAVNAVFLQMRWISLLWGSAISLVSWYAALILGSLRHGEYSFFWIYVIYVLVIVIVYFILRILHERLIPHKQI
jgi:hypothetical protein